MALSKEEWLEKLKQNVPSWFFEEEGTNVAWFSGIAAVLAALHEDADNLYSETVIETMSSDTLDAIGDERSIIRLGDELDSVYRPRLRNISNQSNCPAIKKAVDNIVIAGESTILQDYQADRFMNRESFLNRNEILISAFRNTFSILVEKQIHEPYSFSDREFFTDRGNFVGRAESDQNVFELILQEVSRISMCGTFFRIIELREG